MAAKTKTEREKVYKPKRKNGRNPAVLPTYVDMSHRLYKEYEPAEWECVKCHSNSLLPMEYGCNLCQPFVKGALLTGRIYK